MVQSTLVKVVIAGHHVVGVDKFHEIFLQSAASTVNAVALLQIAQIAVSCAGS